jgi:hypothetical protein
MSDMAACLCLVMRGLDPRIHPLAKTLMDRPGHQRVYARLRRTMPGDDEPRTYAAAGNEAFAFSTIAWKAAGSVMARSDSTLRSTIRPDLFRPSINRL